MLAAAENWEMMGDKVELEAWRCTKVADTRLGHAGPTEAQLHR